ncbi:MAG: PAS domain-containing sensor histidine kinase [Acidobacteria bacterium]|nr:PAS domain-containing sensor histidine kinase [Acidobacteriota bacterium]
MRLFEAPPSSRAARCALGVLVAAVATLIRLVLEPVLLDQVPFAFHFAAVTAAAWIAGVQGGISAVLASAVLVDYVIVHPFPEYSPANHFYGELVFVAVGLALVWQVGRWRRAEQAVRESEARARAISESARRGEAEIASIYDSAPIGLCIFDRQGRFLRINKRLAEMNGPPPEAHIGRTFREVVPDIADQAEQLLRRVLETGEPAMNVEIRGELPSQPGIVRTWSEHWFPVRDETGAIVGVNVAVEEVTERKRVEEELREANQVKDDFLATLSHELRTPLNAILGWAQMLSRGELDQRLTHQAIEAIFRNAQAQNQLVTDVLDVSGMISGKLRLEIQEVDAVALLRQAIESMQPAADAKRLELRIVAGVEPAMIWADPGRLQQVMWNLLSNAVKFTEPGGCITARIARGPSTLDITVTDTGIGIRRDFLPRVFDRFSQAGGSTSREQSGLGLGLSIVRHLVELHGGTVCAMSEGEGRGSTFTVTLPVGVARPQGSPVA